MENQNVMQNLRMGRKDNLLDDLAFGLVNATNYSNTAVPYPDVKVLDPDGGVRPEWFYPLHRGTNDFSELNTINQYISQEALFDEIGEMMLGVALVEMKHLDRLGDLILKLNGSVSQKYETTHVAYVQTAEEAVRLALALEENSIREYTGLLERVKRLPANETTDITGRLLTKFIADECQHRAIFEQWLSQR
ncbi:MAG: hypothetical protein LUG98_12135 [Tannerellaceae bacterium]|nr:hypothetical protein [Tannerellaceae bacterium]